MFTRTTEKQPPPALPFAQAALHCAAKLGAVRHAARGGLQIETVRQIAFVALRYDCVRDAGRQNGGSVRLCLLRFPGGNVVGSSRREAGSLPSRISRDGLSSREIALAVRRVQLGGNVAVAGRTCRAAVVPMRVVAAGLLGGIQGRVGPADQERHALARSQLGHTQAHRHWKIFPLEAESLPQDGMAGPFGSQAGVFERRVGKNDRELLAAITRHEVRAAHGLHEHTRYLAEDGIARGVPAFVVELFEVIQVEHHHAEGRGVPLAFGEAPLEFLVKAAAVEHVGQGIRANFGGLGLNDLGLFCNLLSVSARLSFIRWLAWIMSSIRRSTASAAISSSLWSSSLI